MDQNFHFADEVFVDIAIGATAVYVLDLPTPVPQPMELGWANPKELVVFLCIESEALIVEQKNRR